LPRALRLPALFALLVAALIPFALDARSATPAPAHRTLDDYRHFRVTAIDLLGRMPTREELAAFERSDFDVDKWIDEHLSGPAYSERLTRIYMDVLRLEPNLLFNNATWQLLRHDVQGPDGKPVTIYYRQNQRRERPETDGDFCLSPEETGVIIRARQQDLALPEPAPAPGKAASEKTSPAVVRPPSAPVIAPKPAAQAGAGKTAAMGATMGGGMGATGTMGALGASPMAPPPPPATPKRISQKVLDKYTVLVKPWWLYRDYRTAAPAQLYGQSWKDPDPQYKPVETLLNGPDGKPVSEVRVCREEAQRAESGHIYASGRTKAPPKDAPLPGMRFRPAPLDRPYATQNQGKALTCDSLMALDYAPDCGCGVGLERCIPGDSNNAGNAFYYPNHMPLGPGVPLDDARQSQERWFPYWWSREAVRYIDDLFANDRDFREILTGKRTFVNGPLAQFYRTIQQSNCCGPEAQFGMLQESEPLFDPRNVPADLEPSDVSTWKMVENRGPHAAGLLTTPMFLEKYASARARGAALYNDFLCKSFSAENQQLQPSSEPNLTIRPGCKTCHATLEPLAAYFARVEPANFVFLPQASFPVHNTTCKLDKNGKLNGGCNALYDAAFADAKSATLRSAYASPEHADATPAGAAQDITKMPEFAQCAVQRVTSSFLGRPTTPDDDPLLTSLTSTFVSSGYRMKALVRAILHSDDYRRSNNLGSTTWRGGGK
jgi:hypothetical protein